MPLYEYQCTSCGHRFEVLQRMGEGGEGVSCPQCGAGAPVKQFSSFAASAAGGTKMAARSSGGNAGCGAGFS